MTVVRAEFMPARSWVTVFELSLIVRFYLSWWGGWWTLFVTYLRSGYSVQKVDVVDVGVGVCGLFGEIFVAGDYLGEVDGGGDEGEVEEEGGKWTFE